MFGNYAGLTNVVICNYVVTCNLKDLVLFAGPCPKSSHDVRTNESGRELQHGIFTLDMFLTILGTIPYLQSLAWNVCT